MAQNLASVHFDQSQWGAVDEAISTLERVWWPMLVLLGPDGRRRTIKMGTGSEAFVNASYRSAKENPSLIPGGIDVDEMQRDLASHEALAQRRMRIERLREHLIDTDIALGSDAMAAALQCYGQLKLLGRASGLEPLRRELGRRFDKAPRKRPEAGAAAKAAEPA